MATDSRNLCSNCKLLDIREAFEWMPLLGGRSPCLRSPVLNSMTPSSGCPLCKLFRHFHSISRSWATRPATIALRTSHESEIDGDDRAMVRSLLKGISQEVFLAVVCDPLVAYPFQQPIPLTEIGCILNTRRSEIASRNRETIRVELQNSNIDFPQLKAWQEECCYTHTSSCAKPDEPERIVGMKVIDVYTRDIIPATLDLDYAALSYVWGPGNQETPPNRIPNPAPKTIEDALEVTKGLGIPYLWVDRYCIKQDEENEKHDQISRMHLIYHNAHVTIIAAAGTGPEDGIPGIGGTPRISQPYTELTEGLLVAKFPHPTNVIKRSKWASRGWTYQEAALSRRRLAFTTYGAYFECNDGSYSEGIEEPILRMISMPSRKLRPRLCGGISAWSSHSIWQHIAEFSKRDLSRQEDRMNALLGVFGALEKSGMLKGHLWGIPMQAFSVSVFVKNLMWETNGPARRNYQFPSWSWTGWKGEVGNRQGFLPCMPVTPREHFYVNFNGVCAWVELLNEILVPIEKCHEVLENGVGNEVLSKYIRIRAPTFKCRFTLREKHRLAPGVQFYWSPVVSMHEQELEFPTVEVFTSSKTEGKDITKRMTSETWDVIFWQIHWDRAYFLVLDQFEGYSERFGYFWGEFSVVRQVKLISEERVIRLG